MIDNQTINGIINYVEILNDINVYLIKILSLDCIDNMNILKKLYLELSSKICMIILTEIPKGSNSYKELELIKKKEGINKYATNFSYLKESIDKIFKNNKELLYALKRVRNKIEHDIDIINIDEMHSGSGVCGVIFSIKNDRLTINTNDLKDIVCGLNDLFFNMLKDIDSFVKKYDNERYDHPYYKKLRRYNFNAYNSIINSTIVYNFSLLLNNIKSN